MKIAYIGNFSAHWHEEGIALCLEQLGHTVLRLQEENRPVIEFIKEVREFKPDFVLFAKLRIADALVFVKTMQMHRILTVSWTFDLYMGYVREPQIPYYPFLKADVVFTTDGGHDRQWLVAGINHRTLRQGIHPIDAWIAPKTDGPDVLFVGSENHHYPYRQRMMAKLQDTFPSFRWIGRGNPDEARGAKLNEIVSSAKVIVGDSVPSPSYWSNRIYEMTGRGGFVIHPEVSDFDKEFPEVITYKHGDVDQLIELINFYLEKPDIRESIAEQSYRRCTTDYTFTKRCEILCKQISERLNTGTIG